MSLFIRQAMAPPVNRQNGVCLYTADPSQPLIAEGLLDVAVRESYTLTLLIGSQLLPRGDQLDVRAESNRTHINGAVVAVTDANGGAIREFTSLTTGFVDVGANNQPAYGLAVVSALDAPALQLASADIPPGSTKLILANIKVFGKTLGGVDVESGEFQYPIRICNGCLLDFSTGDDPAVDGRDCNRTGDATAGATQTVPPCNPGQDEATPCESCRDDRPACRGQ